MGEGIFLDRLGGTLPNDIILSRYLHQCYVTARLPRAVKWKNVIMHVNYKYCGETQARELLDITIL